MTREERQQLLKDKRARDAAEQSKKSPQQQDTEQAALQKAIKERKTKYNRATGKLEVID